MWSKIKDWLFPKRFVLTTKGQLGRIERENKVLGTIEISFGSFDLNGWVMSKKVVLSNSSISRRLPLKEAVQRLNKKYR